MKSLQFTTKFSIPTSSQIKSQINSCEFITVPIVLLISLLLPGVAFAASEDRLEAAIMETAQKEETRQENFQENQLALEDSQADFEYRQAEIEYLIKIYQEDLKSLQIRRELYLHNQWEKDESFNEIGPSILVTERAINNKRSQALQESKKAEHARKKAQGKLALVKESAKKVRALEKLRKENHNSLVARKIEVASISDFISNFLAQYAKLDGDMTNVKDIIKVAKSDVISFKNDHKYMEADIRQHDYEEAEIVLQSLEGRKLKYDVAIITAVIGIAVTPLLLTLWFLGAGYDQKLKRITRERIIAKLRNACGWLDEELRGALIEGLKESNEMAKGNMPFFILSCSIKVLEFSFAQSHIWFIDQDPLNSAAISSKIEPCREDVLSPEEDFVSESQYNNDTE
jgi:chromosome segregation ATPase